MKKIFKGIIKFSLYAVVFVFWIFLYTKYIDHHQKQYIAKVVFANGDAAIYSFNQWPVVNATGCIMVFDRQADICSVREIIWVKENE